MLSNQLSELLLLIRNDGFFFFFFLTVKVVSATTNNFNIFINVVIVSITSYWSLMLPGVLTHCVYVNNNL